MKFLHHFSRHREFYIFVPLFVLLLLGAIAGVHFLTGRPLLDDPGAIVGWCLNALGAVLVVVLAAMTQEHLFGFRSEQTESPKFRDDVFDAVISLCLLGFFSWLLFLR